MVLYEIITKRLDSHQSCQDHFLGSAPSKCRRGVPMMVAIFDQIGAGQWFRIFTGVVEIAGAIAILLPVTVAFGAVLLAVTMIGAVFTHLVLIGGNPLPAIVLLAITSIVAWLHRGSLANVLQSHG